MNISQVHSHIPPSSKPHHKPVGWTFLSSFSMMKKYTQRGHLTTQRHAWPTAGPGAAGLQRYPLLPVRPVLQGTKWRWSYHPQNCGQKCHITGSIKLLFNYIGFLVAQRYTVLKPPLYIHKVINSILVVTPNDSVT